jgi:hypothetical protein
VIDRVQERFRLKLECPLGYCDQLLEEGQDFVASPVIPGVVLFARLVLADLVGEEHTDSVPVTSGARLV